MILINNKWSLVHQVNWLNIMFVDQVMEIQQRDMSATETFETS